MRWALLVVLAGCNALLGIHEIEVDGGGTAECSGVCECREDADCPGEHRVCDDQITSRVCACAAGYTMQGVCTWTGVVLDPGFTTTNTWSVTAPAGHDSTLVVPAGMYDPGAATFPVSCAKPPPGVVGQALLMPRFSRAEPLVAKISYGLINGEGGGGGGNQNELATAFGIATTWNATQLQITERDPGWFNARVCLGAGHYAPESSRGRGVGLPLALSGNVVDRCNEPSTVGFDRFEIVPAEAADNCALPGTVPNGDAEGSGGWLFVPPANTTAAIVPGVGVGNSAGVRLTSTQRCSYPHAYVQVSVPMPDQTGAPALSAFHKLTGAATLTMLLDDRSLMLSGGAQGATDRYCLPSYMHGGVVVLHSYLAPGSGTQCTDAVNVSAVLDDVTVVNDPLCASDDAGVADSGFESGLALIHGNASGTAAIRIATDAMAPAGSRVLQFSVQASCDFTAINIPVITPAAPAGNGPALKFTYRYPSETTSTFSMPGASGTPAFAPTRDMNFHDGMICLDPSRTPGIVQNVTASLYGGGTVCGATLAVPGGFALDELRVTFDPLCAPP